MIITFLVISLLVNLVFLFYSRWLITIIKAKEEDLQDLLILISEYVTHIKSVHEMEMFYGDQTLNTLIKHGNDLVDTIERSDFIIFSSEETVENTEEKNG